MKQKLKTILVALLMPCAALAGDWRDGDAKFSTKPNRAETLVVSWMVVADSDVQATCEAFSKDRGLGGFGIPVAACSFWKTKTCLIYFIFTDCYDNGGEMISFSISNDAIQ